MSDINGQTDYRDKPGTDSAYTGSGAAYVPRNYRKPGTPNPKNSVDSGTVSGQMGAQKPGTSSAGGVLSGGTIVGGTSNGAQKPGTSSAGGAISGGTINGQSVIPQKAAAGGGSLSYQSYVPTKADSGTVTAQMQGSMKPGSTVPTGTTGTGSAGSQPEAAAANTRSYADLINQQYNNMAQQAQQNIDYQTQHNVNTAVRSYEDAIPSYRETYRQATVNQYNGADNAALGARASGQYGGMATANVNAVQSQYQQQRAEIAMKQQKLAEQTVRQVADLRAQGEFQKADQLLQQAQQRFQQLYEDAVRVDENTYSNWQYQNTMDREDAAIERSEAQSEKEYQQSLGLTLLKMGVMPDETILKALGISSSTAKQYINMVLYGYA